MLVLVCPKPFSGHSRWESYFLRWQPPRADFRLPGLPPDPHHTPQTTPAHGRIPYRYHITKVWAARVYLCVCLVQARSLWLPQALNQALRCQCTCVGYVRSKQWARCPSCRGSHPRAVGESDIPIATAGGPPTTWGHFILPPSGGRMSGSLNLPNSCSLSFTELHSTSYVALP